MTRRELKEQLQHDHFTDAVSEIVEYAQTHRRQVTRWIVAAAVVLAAAGAAFWYASYQKSVRQRDLQAAFTVLETPVGPPNGSVKSFPTEQAKRQGSMKALSNLLTKDGGTREGLIAEYYLGTLKAQSGDAHGAEANLKAVADSSNECAPLAKIALAQLYAGQNKVPEAQNLLRGMVNKPTDLVSKAQAEILLAQLDKGSNPREARKILQSLKTPNQDPVVARAADEISSQLPK